MGGTSQTLEFQVLLVRKAERRELKIEEYIREHKDGLELLKQVEELKRKSVNATRKQGEEESSDDFSQV